MKRARWNNGSQAIQLEDAEEEDEIAEEVDEDFSRLDNPDFELSKTHLNEVEYYDDEYGESIE